MGIFSLCIDGGDCCNKLIKSCGEGLLCDDVIEFLLRDQAIVIGIGSFDHLLQF
jgi:hypothetical protein